MEGTAEGVQVDFNSINAALPDRELFAQSVGRFLYSLTVSEENYAALNGCGDAQACAAFGELERIAHDGALVSATRIKAKARRIP